jgi:hypothetical protein
MLFDVCRATKEVQVSQTKIRKNDTILSHDLFCPVLLPSIKYWH